MKFDFLGLKTLTVLDIAVRLVNARPDFVRDGKTLDLSRILPDRTTRHLQAPRVGRDQGRLPARVDGMQQLFEGLSADSFEDIVAAVALYRPGPMGAGMHEDFVKRKHGRAPIASLHPLIDELLKPTYGVIVYQEQVMQIAQKLAGYTLGGADLLRRAMGKKKPEEMAKQKSIFVDGREEQGRRRGRGRAHLRAARVLRGLRLQQEPLGGVRAHHVPDGVAQGALPGGASLRDPHERQGPHREGRAHDRRRARDGRDRLPPDVNESDTDFKVVYTHPRRQASRGAGATASQDALGPQIRFGLGAVRGLGGAALEAVFEARRGGPFRDLFDLAARVDAKRVNKAVFEALVQCGAFDSTLQERGRLARAGFASIDIALERSRAASRDREAGQTTLFGLFDAAPQPRRSAPSAGDYAECQPWDRRELLVRERQSLGFYVSGHPLERYLKGDAGLAKIGASAARRVRGDGRLGAREARRAWSRATASASSRTAEARSRSSSSRT